MDAIVWLRIGCINPKSRPLTAIGVASTVFDPCGNTPEHGNFMDVMRRNLENLKKSY